MGARPARVPDHVEFYSVRAAAKFFSPKVGEHTLRRAIAMGLLIANPVGNRKYLTRTALQNFVEQRRG